MRVFAVLAALALATTATAGTPSVILEVEGGQVWQTVNDIQSPNTDAGTRFSLVDAVGKGPWNAGRAYLTWNINEKHGLRALYAPLSITEAGVLGGPVTFEGSDFAAGAATATYTFDSYRLSYRYRLAHSPGATWWIGFTAKVRDAVIALDQGDIYTEKTNTGFVPLLHLAADWRLSGDWRLTFDADALAGGPGRAEDVALKLARDLGDSLRISAGYRLVEGGADVEEVYSFAWFHYAVGSVRLAF